jgi:hypothetical protein
MKLTDSAWFACAALVVVLPSQTIAQTSIARQTAPSPLFNSAGFDNPVARATLDDYRAGTQVVSSDLQLAGTTAGNSATHVMTGSNAITAGAFANMSGLPVVIQNSGANVLIQNATILNLQLN